uniref:BED-type domain-containing protein n=1 Tax=Oryza brachyantha TaxID=4533 RepID=J3NEH1_ORYBR
MPNGKGNPPKRRRSLVWEHMKIDEPSIDMATCIHCSNPLTAKSIGGTSHLIRHITKCLKRKGLTEELDQFLTKTKGTNYSRE